MKKNTSLVNIVRRGFSRTAIGLESEEIAKIALAESMAEVRSKIRSKLKGKGGNPEHNAAVGRFAHDQARALKKEIVQNRRPKVSPLSLIRHMSASPLLDALDRERAKKWKKPLSRRFQSELPRISLNYLNFLDRPIETMEELLKLSKAEQELLNAYLDFDDTYCHDIGAFLVVAEIWPQLGPVFRGGRMSPAIQKVLDAVKLGRDLNIRLNNVHNHDNVWPFEIRRRRPRGTTQSATAQLQPQGREQLNDKLVGLIDEWLAVASDHISGQQANSDETIWSLTGDGKANIANMVGEILDNAERHSSGDGDGDWSMAAFMAKRDGENGAPPAMKCYLAFLSVGRSIAETIAESPEPTRSFCHKYASAHAREGQAYETLLTIAALQDGVTSSVEASQNRRGGTGLQDTLDFIGDLGGAPKAAADVHLTIVSGKSCIKLSHPILVGKSDGKNRRVQWCNVANDPTYPPDRSIAFDLPAHFAGTLVSVAFTLDPSLFVPDGESE